METRNVMKINLIFRVLQLLLIMLPLTTCFKMVVESEDDIGGETEQTKNVIVQFEGQTINNTLIEGVHAPRISIQLIFRNTSYSIDLTLNIYLLSPSYVERIVNGSSVTYLHGNRNYEMCYYNGAIRGEENSGAAFSTCKGVKGFLVLNNSTFHIRPLLLEGSTLIGLYEIKKVTNDHLSHWICGTQDLKREFNKIKNNQRTKRQIIPSSLDGKNVVELYVANDNRRLSYFKGDINMLSRSTREIVNTANLLYQPVGFFVVLVGSEYWSSDPIVVSTDSSKTLSSWHNYRYTNILNKHYNDDGFLISRQSFDASVLGLASIGTMCSSKNSGGLMTAIEDRSSVSGAILAHEMGHNFGLSHDSSDCSCQSSDVACIMSARASTDKPALYFSSCSKAQLSASINKGFDICLKDFPLDLGSHYPVCGNGILEQGEDCDCGRMPIGECNPNCCNPSTCKLTTQAKCASGKCCDVNSCQLKGAGFQCRSAVGSCDLAEVCDGGSAFCPKNLYKHDGMSCSLDGVDAYCWSGMCRTQRFQCKELYGPSVAEGASSCYEFFNSVGNMNGWCGITFADPIQYTRCPQEDVMCGTLQCNSNSASLVKYTNFVFQTNKNVGTSQCKGSVLDYGSRVENPGMVPNGASCGLRKMCVSQKCISVDSKLNENPCPTCVHGTCTNEGRCLCDQGFYGPTCDNTEPQSSLTAGEIVGIVISIILLIALILLLAFCLRKSYKNGSLTRLWDRISEKVPQTPAKIRSIRSEPSEKVFRNSSGQENMAYETDVDAISVVTRANAIIPTSGRNSFYPQYDREVYEELDPTQLRFVTNDSIKSPPPRPNHLPFSGKSNPTWEINLSPSSQPPPVPSQHAKPLHVVSKPPPPAQSVKPGNRPSLAAKTSRPNVPPASAKPKALPDVSSSSPVKSKFTPPQPPTFPSKPKPSRPAPGAPVVADVGDGEESSAGDVRRLRAMFDSIV